MEDRLSSFILELDERILIVKGVPTRVCSQCGEKAYRGEVSLRLEQIANTFKNSGDELTVTHYSDRAA